MEGRGEKRNTPTLTPDGDAAAPDGGGPGPAPPALAASEYPISLDALPPPPGHHDAPGASACFDLRTAPAAVRHNALHRHTLSTRTIAHYCRLEQIGEGTYGQVYRAECLAPTLARPRGGAMVALKKIRLHHPGYMGIPPTVIREIKILKKLQHRNLVKMYEVVSSKGADELDWEDEREDERRRREGRNREGTSPLAGRDGGAPSSTGGNADAKSSKKGDDKKGGGGRDDASKKKKKDAMSDLEKLRESYKGNLFLVLEYISHDLTGLLDMAYKFTEVQTKSVVRQLLEVLEFMHLRNYVHRDLKSSNVLITDRFEVKLADFGLARCLESSFIGRMGSNDYNAGINSNDGEYTNKVITLWYRPPELLLGETKYGTAVDIWSAGCILAEIILGRPIFTGKTDMDQLKLIFDLIGTPTDRSWEGFGDLKLIRTGEVTIDRVMRPKLREKYRARIQPATALDLLEKTLELDPKKRFTASGALRHRYFQSEPVAPDDPRALGTIDLGGDGAGYHEFQTKKRRREAKAVAKGAEEESKKRGESLESQKLAFDEAYRNHLTKGAGAEGKKDAAPWQQQQPSREQPQESRPWEEYQEQQYQHQYDGTKQRRPLDRDQDPSRKRGRYHHGRMMNHGGSRDGNQNSDTSGRDEPVVFSRDEGPPKGSLPPDQNERRVDSSSDRPGHQSAPPIGDRLGHQSAPTFSDRPGHKPASSFGNRSGHPSGPPFGRQYDQYGNPVADGRMPSGPDRNNRIPHGQDSWGDQRGRDGWAHNPQGFNRPPDWGRGPRGRGGRGGQGGHPSWPRNG